MGSFDEHIHSANNGVGRSPKRCLIENTEEVIRARYTQLLPSSTSRDMISHLEYVWNMDLDSLNINTKENAIRLNAKMRKLFNEKTSGWMLIPEHRILKYYIDEWGQVPIADYFPEVNEGTYRYTLIAHSSMKKVYIHRQTVPLDEDFIPYWTDYINHSYPFPQFPVIQSRIHPRYVICNAGEKLIHNLMSWNPKYLRDLTMIRNIWLVWKSNLLDSRRFMHFTFRRTVDDDRDPINPQETSAEIESESAPKPLAALATSRPRYSGATTTFVLYEQLGTVRGVKRKRETGDD